MHLYKLGLLFILGVTSVLPTLFGNFVFDDGEAIIKNGDVISPESDSIYNIFSHDFWGVSITHPQSHKSYRPLTTISFRWDYMIWKKNPLPFHLLNLVIHGINCVMVYFFLKKCLGCLKNSNEIEIIYWATVLFSVHPIHVEPLGGLVGRADLLSSMTFLAGFIIVPENRIFTPFLISTFAIIGSLFKENAFVVSMLYVAVDIIIKNNFKVSKSKIFNHFLTTIFTFCFVGWRLWFQEGPPEFQRYDNPPAFAENVFSKVFSIIYVWGLNIYLLVNPVWLCYDWSMGCVKLIESLNDLRLVFILFLFVIGVRLAYLAFRSKIIMASLLISVATFLPCSNLIFTVGFVLAERNLYLPSIGFSLLISYVFIQRKKQKLLLFIIFIFYMRSLQRSVHWIDQVSLFKSGLEVCPNNAKIHYNLGTMYGEQNNTTLAITAYKTALNLRPDYYQAMNNLGNVLRYKTDLNEAEFWLRKAVEIKTDFAAAWMNLGIVMSKKNATEAMLCYQKALEYRKKYPDCLYNIGNLYLDVGENTKALETWMRATSMKPTHAQAWINIVILLDQEGKTSEAKQWALKASAILRQDDTLQFILGNILGKLSEFELAEKHFEKAISLSKAIKTLVPSKYYANLGVLYHRWGKKQMAIISYNKALQIDPYLESAKKNLAMLKVN